VKALERTPPRHAGNPRARSAETCIWRVASTRGSAAAPRLKPIAVASLRTRGRRPPLPLCRLGSYVNAAAALGASQLEAEAANHAGYVFEAPGVRGRSHLKHMVSLLDVAGTTLPAAAMIDQRKPEPHTGPPNGGRDPSVAV